MTAQTNLLSPSRIRPDIRNMLEYHVLEALPLREACRRAGLRYTKNASQHKFTKVGQAFVEQLRRRRRVIVEFGADIPALARLIEIRDEALEAGSLIAATRAHELCIREASKAKADGKGVGGRKEVDEMSREELLAEISQIELKAGGKGFEVDIDPEDVEYLESMGRTKKTQAKG